MNLKDFSGGLSQRLAPHLININEASQAINMDLESGILKSCDGVGASALAEAQYAYYFESQASWVSFAAYTNFLEHQDILYYSVTGSYPRKYDGINTYRLGIEAPTVAPTVAVRVSGVTSEPTTVTLTPATTGGDFPPETTLEYLIVAETANYFSTFITDTVTTGSTTSTNQITVTIPVVAGQAFTIFRKYNGEYRKITTLPAGTPTIVDSTYIPVFGTSYVETRDKRLDGTYQYVYTYYNSADGTESLPSALSLEESIYRGSFDITITASADPQVDRINLYRVGGSLTDLTLVNWYANTTATRYDILSDTSIIGTILDSTYNNEAPDGLDFLIEQNGVMFGAVGDKVYYTRQGLPNAWPSTQYIEFPTEVKAIGIAANGIIACTRYKSWIITGTGTGLFTKYSLSDSHGCYEHQTMKQLDGILYWASDRGICASNGNNIQLISENKLGDMGFSVLTPLCASVDHEEYYLQTAYNYIYSFNTRTKKWRTFQLSTTFLANKGITVYGRIGSNYYEMFAGSAANKTYTSPILIEGRYSELKTYKQIYVSSSGTLQIQVYIDGVLVQTKSISTTSTKVTEFSIPQAKQLGYSIFFTVTGTGVLQEIDYGAMGRQNAR